MFLEAVGDVLEEDQTEDNVLVFRGVHVGAELIGSEPKLGFKANVSGVIRFSGRSGARHESAENSRKLLR
jgi:hypothetical protein